MRRSRRWRAPSRTSGAPSTGTRSGPRGCSSTWTSARRSRASRSRSIGRTLETTLPELSSAADSGKAHVKLRFRVERISGDGVAEAKFIGHDLTSDYVRRLARRKRSKIDLALTVTTKDGVQIILKPVAVGEQRLQTRLRAELRHRIVKILTEEAQQKASAEFVHEMLQGELSKLLAHGVKSLYPLKKIEIRRSIVLGIDQRRASGTRPRGRPRRADPSGRGGRSRRGLRDLKVAPGSRMDRPLTVGVAQPGRARDS